MLAGIYFLMILSKIVSPLILCFSKRYFINFLLYKSFFIVNSFFYKNVKIKSFYNLVLFKFFKMRQVIFDSIDTVQINHYLKTRVLPILQPLQMQILQQKPTNIKQFSYHWLQRFKQNEQKKQQFEESDDEQPQQVFKQRIRRKRQKQGKVKFRVGVSGESSSIVNLNNHQIIGQNEIHKFQHTEQTKVKIIVELRNSILFKNMSHSSLMNIIDRMRPIQYSTGDVVIKQGDDGNQLFIVDEGFFKCKISGKRGQQKIYGPGEAFGQLALLYNTKRATTILAQTDGRLYALDRVQFNSILRENVLKKSEMCDRILSNIEIFQTLDRYEKSKVYEALQEIQVQAGKYIIREGQVGDSFYIVAQGKLVAQKMENNELKPVYYYKQGDYFGELALIKNIVRQASVKALTKVRLLYLQRSAFKRLLGSIQTILRKNQNRYKNSPKRTKARKQSYQNVRQSSKQ